MTRGTNNQSLNKQTHSKADFPSKAEMITRLLMKSSTKVIPSSRSLFKSKLRRFAYKSLSDKMGNPCHKVSRCLIFKIWFMEKLSNKTSTIAESFT